MLQEESSTNIRTLQAKVDDGQAELQQSRDERNRALLEKGEVQRKYDHLTQRLQEYLQEKRLMMSTTAEGVVSIVPDPSATIVQDVSVQTDHQVVDVSVQTDEVQDDWSQLLFERDEVQRKYD